MATIVPSIADIYILIGEMKASIEDLRVDVAELKQADKANLSLKKYASGWIAGVACVVAAIVSLIVHPILDHFDFKL